MNNARKKIAAGCMAVLLSMTSVYSVCAAETGIKAAGGSGSISAGAETAFVGNGNILYQPLKITGALMPEEQIFSGKDLNEILEAESLGLTKLRSYLVSGTPVEVKGIDLAAFLMMCGVENDAPEDAVIQIFTEDKVEPAETVRLRELNQNGSEALLTSEENGKRIFLSGGENGADSVLEGVTKILVSTPEDLSDPHYGFHSEGPLSYMQDMTFTVNFVDKDSFKEGEEAEPFKTITYTMKEIEKMMADHPEQVFGNYFGISGNEEMKDTLGLGGFSDYFEGLSMSWFLREQAGLKDGEGFALFYGRDNDLFGRVEDLAYFFPKDGDYSRYYLELTNTFSVSGAVPVIAVSKNGYPLLPDHDHDLEGNVDYNTFNANALAKGFETEIGLVKNVSGPFIAGLANLDGVYGGYRNETSGDCIRVDLYVDKSQYGQSDSSKYTDVAADSWYAEYVDYLSEKGIINGRTESLFAPEAPVTRAEFVKLIAGIDGADVTKYSTSTFDDVKAGAWYAPYVAWGAETGIINGTGTAAFHPDGKISRQDMAVILYRYTEKNGISLKNENTVQTFTDASEIASYATDAVTAMQKAGIINGRSGQRFAPAANASRAEACKMLTILDRQIP